MFQMDAHGLKIQEGGAQNFAKISGMGGGGGGQSFPEKLPGLKAILGFIAFLLKYLLKFSLGVLCLHSPFPSPQALPPCVQL